MWRVVCPAHNVSQSASLREYSREGSEERESFYLDPMRHGSKLYGTPLRKHDKWQAVCLGVGHQDRQEYGNNELIYPYKTRRQVGQNSFFEGVDLLLGQLIGTILDGGRNVGQYIDQWR